MAYRRRKKKFTVSALAKAHSGQQMPLFRSRTRDANDGKFVQSRKGKN